MDSSPLDDGKNKKIKKLKTKHLSHTKLQFNMSNVQRNLKSEFISSKKNKGSRRIIKIEQSAKNDLQKRNKQRIKKKKPKNSSGEQGFEVINYTISDNVAEHDTEQAVSSKANPEKRKNKKQKKKFCAQDSTKISAKKRKQQHLEEHLKAKRKKVLSPESCKKLKLKTEDKNDLRTSSDSKTARIEQLENSEDSEEDDIIRNELKNSSLLKDIQKLLKNNPSFLAGLKEEDLSENEEMEISENEENSSKNDDPSENDDNPSENDVNPFEIEEDSSKNKEDSSENEEDSSENEEDPSENEENPSENEEGPSENDENSSESGENLSKSRENGMVKSLKKTVPVKTAMKQIHDGKSKNSSIDEGISKINYNGSGVSYKDSSIQNINEGINELPLENSSSGFERSQKKSSSSTTLRNKAMEKLQAAKFRYLNEKLYTESGKDSFTYFQKNKDEYMDYHKGYSLQVAKWPVNPVDKVISSLQKIKRKLVIADMGCGDAKIARTLSNCSVHSFDLVALNEHVVPCNISKVPLSNESVDVVVFCLSLMGTNLKEYLQEAYRIMKFGGLLKIAEVESRVPNLDEFIKSIQSLGFKIEQKDVEHKLFIFLEFKKMKKKKASKIKDIQLKPCLYKKR